MAAPPTKGYSQSEAIHSSFNANENVVSFDNFQKLASPRGPIDVEAEVAEINKNGYIILKNVLTQNELKGIKVALEPHLTHLGRNRFEGEKTQRVYALLSKSRAFDSMLIHPRIMAILKSFLLPNFLATAFQAIKILPAETRQPYHHDDQFMNIQRPHRPFSVATIWAIDDFTETNGSTLVFPKSHLWGEEKPPNGQKPISVIMPAVTTPSTRNVAISESLGSVVVFLSTLWHGGGANTANLPRLAVSAQYCEPWIRPQENQFLSIPPSLVPQLDPEIQTLIGYSIHPPFIGHVNGLHPLKAIEHNELNETISNAKL